MTGPDLAALREVLRSDAEKALARDTYVRANPSSLLAVLSLVDDLRAALTYVGEFARAHHHQQPAHVLLHSLTIDIPELVERALAGSPAANEEQQ